MWRLLPKLARVSGVLLVLAGVVVGLRMHRARAELRETFMSMGAEMLRYEFANPQLPPQKYQINGQTFWLNTGNTERPVEEVLDWFEVRCMDHDGGLGEQLEETLETADVEVDSRLLDPTIRESEAGRRGFVACLDPGPQTLGIEDVAARVQSFMNTLRLSDIGDFRFAYVKKGRRKTIFITLWTEGTIDLGAMFAEGGDVPGADVPGVPRPRGFRRILSVLPDEQPQSITMYQGEGSKAQVQAFYKEQMPLRGWRRVELTQEEAEKLPFEMAPTGDQLLYYKMGGRDVGVVVDDIQSPNRPVAVVFTL